VRLRLSRICAVRIHRSLQFCTKIALKNHRNFSCVSLILSLCRENRFSFLAWNSVEFLLLRTTLGDVRTRRECRWTIQRRELDEAAAETNGDCAWVGDRRSEPGCGPPLRNDGEVGLDAGEVRAALELLQMNDGARDIDGVVSAAGLERADELRLTHAVLHHKVRHVDVEAAAVRRVVRRERPEDRVGEALLDGALDLRGAFASAQE
jgi:hypothetical protein